MIILGGLIVAALKFAWPAHAEAQVELTDERAVGDERRTIVMTMRLRVEPDAGTDRLVVRLSDAKLVAIDGASPGDTDPTHTLLAVGRVMKSITPTMVVDHDGRYLETRDLDRLTREVLAAAGLPSLPVGSDPLSQLLSDVAAEDWSAWIGAWIGNTLAAGESTETERSMHLGGATVPVRLTRLEASAVYPSESVGQYTRGFLIDMARKAKELGDDDPAASVRFLEKARYSPLTETLTVELETATMRPLVAERLRTFGAVKGKHKVEGRERRTHRFAWVTD